MKPLPLLFCLLALAATPLAAAEVKSTPSPKKKRSTASAEKAKTTDESPTPAKPSSTPAPARKKPSASEGEDTTASATKKATPAPTKKAKTLITDEAAAPTKKKELVGAVEDGTPSPPKQGTTAPKDEPATSASTTLPAATPAPKPARAPSASLEPAELTEFADQPARVQQLLTASLALTKLNLTYTFGSADPARGGMDCSGTIHHVLRAQGFDDVPRDSSSQYVWARKAGRFFPVVSLQADGVEFSDLQPGDLMFWTGTYQTGRDIPISHVMLYLGREKATGKRVMFGASDGRSYAGVQRWGVSVFDFKMPKVDPTQPDKRVGFVGYARIPGLRP